MNWEIGEGHIDIHEVWESVKEKCEYLTYQLLFCNYVSVVGWSGCDQKMMLTKSLLWLLCGFGLTHLVVMDWEIGEGHVCVNEVWESVKEKCECLTYQLLFCNYVSVVGWSGCDQILRLTESLFLIVVWFWSYKFGGDGLRNRRRSHRHKWGNTRPVRHQQGYCCGFDTWWQCFSFSVHSFH